jgi:hypothetical protein
MTDREWQTTIKNALDAEAFPELDHDLWPRMHARLTAARPSPSRWDLLLLAAIVVLSFVFPEMLLNLFYHL